MNRRHNPEEKDIQRIREYLANHEVQERILASMQDVRDKASVTTRVAATIFNLGEQRLRDWEGRGFLQGRRSTDTASQEGKTGKHRQFTLNELEKLAILKELVDVGDFNLGSIPPDVEKIWQDIITAEEKQAAPVVSSNFPIEASAPINQRIDTSRTKLLWRFFATQALRFALLLLAEDMPGEAVGLVFPLGKESRRIVLQKVDDLPLLGESLVGWLTRSRSMHALLTPRPSFEVPLDFRLLPLVAMRNDEPVEELPEENMYLIVPRKSKKLTLSAEIIQTIHALLRPFCTHAEELRNCFGPDMYDVLEPAPDLTQSEMYPDIILNGLADIIVELGGLKESGESRWRFCCILLPKDPSLPLYQRSLVVRAQSEFSPHKIGFASVSPEEDDNSLSLRAYQSGRISARDKIAPDSSANAFRDIEHPVKAAIAIPIGSESGEPSAVMYVTSENEGAFSSQLDRRVLRLVGRMVDELVKVYQVRRNAAENLLHLMRFPDVVDEYLGKFLSESDFVHDLDALLTKYKTSREEQNIGLIGIDVDHMGKLALMYGDLAVRNLCEGIGQRIQGELASTFRKYPECKLYHMYADRFYLIIQNIAYDEIIQKAWLLKESLDGAYKISIFSPHNGQPPAPGTLINLPITVRLAISHYNNKTFEELFQLYMKDTAVYSVREMLENSLSIELKKGMEEEGNNIRAWIPKSRKYEPLEKDWEKQEERK